MNMRLAPSRRDGRGHSYHAAGDHLEISVNTVRSCVRIYDKLHVHSKSEAVSKAFRRGLIV